MRWIWDDNKNRKHGFSFETAQLVFNDPLALSRADTHSDGDRYQTVGRIGPVLVFVVHTWPYVDHRGDEVGRIIGARKATSHERKAYEEGHF